MNNNSIDDDVQAIVNALGGKKSGDGWICHCPAHDDKTPSLSVSVSPDGKLLYHCHAGCSQDVVTNKLRARGLIGGSCHYKSKRRTEYIYEDNNGPALKVTRIDFEDKTKKIYRSHIENGHWISGDFEGEVKPYRYGEWENKPDEWIFLVEGEKTADSLTSHGLLATTTPGGSGAWRAHYAKHFKDRRVVILPDNDDPGFKYAAKAYNDIVQVTKEVRVIELQDLNESEDAFDWFEKGHTTDELVALVEMPQPLSERFQEHTKAKTNLNDAIDDEPLPLRRPIPDGEPYPFEALGPILGKAAKRIFEIIKCPDAIAAHSLLGGAALAVQGHCDVELDGRQNPVSIFLLSIADSGERKSAADLVALAPHRVYERQLHEKHEIGIREYALEKQAYEAMRTQILRTGKTREEKRNALRMLGDPPLPPLEPIIHCEEPTAEGLYKLLENGQPSEGVFSDEGGRLFGGHGMQEENRLKTATFYSELWDGKRVTRVRSGDGASALYGKRVSMHMMLQGVIANVVLADPIFNQQGFLARYLIASPKAMSGSRSYERIDIYQDETIKAYHARVTELLNMPCRIVGKRKNELDPHVLTVTSKAKALWIKCYNEIEDQLADEQPLHSVKPFGSKAMQHVLRLAAVLTKFENPNSTEIDVTEMGNAITLVQYYLGETLRLNSSGALDSDILLAEKLLTFAQSQPDNCIHLAKIYQYGPEAVRDKKTAQKIIRILEDHRWFIKVNGPMKLDGVVRKEVWRVRK